MMSDAELNRKIIAGDISRDPTGSRLTPQARERAIDFGVNAWKGDMGCGRAVELGIKHVMSDILTDV